MHNYIVHFWEKLPLKLKLLKDLKVKYNFFA